MSSEPEVPWPKPNGVVATYDLHCHCGAVRYKITLSPPLFEEQTEGKARYEAVECNCSHCDRHGAMNVHPPAKDVEFVKGAEDRKLYYSGPKKNPHWICSKCGCFLGTDLTWLMENLLKEEPRYAINLRMLKDFDKSKLQTRLVTQMKDWDPPYTVD